MIGKHLLMIISGKSAKSNKNLFFFTSPSFGFALFSIQSPPFPSPDQVTAVTAGEEGNAVLPDGAQRRCRR
jgi:hypothetical protein